MPAYGAYPIADAKNPGDEISSTGEGRHISLLESDLVHPSHSDAFVDKGDPVVSATGQPAIVGVAFKSAIVATDLIAIDTEGIWNLDVVAVDDDGNSAVAGGDVIYINTSTAVLSKISAAATQVHFGYALGIITSGNTEAIAVKVHWDPLIAAQLQIRGTPGDGVVFASVGKSGNPLVYGAASDKAMEVWAKFTFPTTGGFYAIEGDVSYEPTGDSGYGTPVGVVGRVTLAEGDTFTGGQAGMEGVRGHLELTNTSVLDQASSIFCGLRGVLTATGTPTYTAFDTIACLYLDNLDANDKAGIGAKGAYLASFQNHGGTLDAALHLRGGNKCTYVFSFLTFVGAIETGNATGGPFRTIPVEIDGVAYKINAYGS